jgi:hypothetical protein
MKHSFTYYLHDDYQRNEAVEFLTDPQYNGLPEHIAKKIADQRPFYEVTVKCEYDEKTGKVEVLEVIL